jgi:hypothetical protein
MRVLEIVHGFPPSAQGGAEIYAWTHARALRDLGDHVLVLTRDADATRQEYDVHETVVDGLRVIRINNTFASTRRSAPSHAMSSTRSGLTSRICITSRACRPRFRRRWRRAGFLSSTRCTTTG